MQSAVSLNFNVVTVDAEERGWRITCACWGQVFNGGTDVSAPAHVQPEKLKGPHMSSGAERPPDHVGCVFQFSG